MTNAEKIRNMSIEDMAAVIMCPYDMPEPLPEMCKEKTCMQCTIEWLQKESQKESGK